MSTLRPYQSEAVESVFREWEDKTSTLIVCPTGTGKTETFCEIIKRMQPKRAIVLAHRGELITQAVKRLWKFGIEADVEMADKWADENYWSRAPVVVSTVQTQISGNAGAGRMRRFDPNDFGLVVCDEAHHYTAPSFRKVLDHYRQNPEIKILGVTATPDRADEAALGQVFDSVAFDYEILDAIHDGWLVPVEQQMVNIEGLDFSKVRTTAGDLNGADLAAVMEAEKNLHGIASSSLAIIKDRKTLVFTVTVKQAERLAEIFNRHRPGMADWVCGMTPKDQRHKILKDFSDNRTQILVNVGVLTEGYDEPAVEIIVQARPTKSRCLYAQIIGRALRPLTGTVDGWDSSDDRIQAIAQSSKPSALVLDFVGNSGKHKLMTTADILGGKVSEEAIEKAIAKAKKANAPVRMDEELDHAEKNVQAEIQERKDKEARRRAHVVAQAEYKTRSVDPFDIFDLKPVKARGWDSGKTLSEPQRAVLLRAGINTTGMPYSQQKQLLLAVFERRNNKLATLKQCRALRKRGVTTDGLTFEQASQKLNEISAKEGWKSKNGNGQSTAPPAPIRPAPVPGSPVDEPPWMKDLFG
jgi:superfamily II DNA or RNA helicase